MSIAAFIIGLLIWFSVPAFLQRKVGAEKMHVVKIASKWAGIIIILLGMFHGI